MSSQELDHRDLLTETRRALAHLYDPVYLQRSPLFSLLMQGENVRIAPGREAQALRQLLLDMLEQLAPGRNVPLRSRKWRPYAALQGIYVDQTPIEELAQEMLVGERQLRRDLRAGIEALAAIISRRIDRAMLTDSAPGHDEGANEWIDPDAAHEMSPSRSPVDLCAELGSVLALASPLAKEQGVVLCLAESDERPIVRGDRVILRQILLSLCTWAIGLAEDRVQASVLTDDRRVVFRLELVSDDEGADHSAMPHALEGLARATGARLAIDRAEGRAVLSAWIEMDLMPVHTILLIDDNASLHELFKRYLGGLPYAVHDAYDVPTGFERARALLPEAIVLDIMMPDQDGWDLMARLREDPITDRIPIIICSVLEHEALAQALDIQGYLKKPVTQQALLGVLRELGVGPPA